MTNAPITDSILLSISRIERMRGYVDAVKPGPPGHSQSLSEQWFLNAHRDLIGGGTYRTKQAYLSDPETGVIEYVPPAPIEIEPLMREFLGWLYHPGTLHPLLIAATAHFRLVQIHPFLNGNGRIARLLTTHILDSNGYHFHHLIPLTTFDRPTYYRAIQEVRDRDFDLTPWFEYFLNHLATQVAKIPDLLVTALAPDLTARESQVLGYALGAAQFTLSDLEKEFPTYHRRTWQRALRTLVDRQLLQESGATNRRHYRLS